jgi:hypothetical protein
VGNPVENTKYGMTFLASAARLAVDVIYTQMSSVPTVILRRADDFVPNARVGACNALEDAD